MRTGLKNQQEREKSEKLHVKTHSIGLADSMAEFQLSTVGSALCSTSKLSKVRKLYDAK